MEGFTQTQISTLAVRDKLLIAGGFQGELICKVLLLYLYFFFSVMISIFFNYVVADIIIIVHCTTTAHSPLYMHCDLSIILIIYFR